MTEAEIRSLAVGTKLMSPSNVLYEVTKLTPERPFTVCMIRRVGAKRSVAFFGDEGWSLAE